MNGVARFIGRRDVYFAGGSAIAGFLAAMILAGVIDARSAGDLHRHHEAELTEKESERSKLADANASLARRITDVDAKLNAEQVTAARASAQLAVATAEVERLKAANKVLQATVASFKSKADGGDAKVTADAHPPDDKPGQPARGDNLPGQRGQRPKLSDDEKYRYFRAIVTTRDANIKRAEAEVGPGGEFDSRLLKLDRASRASINKRYGVTEEQAMQIMVEATERGWWLRLRDEEKDKSGLGRAAYATKQEPSGHSESDERYGAKMAAEEFVKKQLNHPSAAKFPWFGADAKRGNDGSWTVTGTVKAKNSFNLETTLSYKCIVRKIGNERWECVECNVVESDD